MKNTDNENKIESIMDFSRQFEYENGFYLTSEPYRLGNILAHYELYKMIINLPGDLLDLQ